MSSLSLGNPAHRLNAKPIAPQEPDPNAKLGVELLDCLPMPLLIVDREAHILHATPAGAALLHDGRHLRLDQLRRCCAASAATTFVLRGKIAEAMTQRRRCYLSLPSANRAALAACIIPLGGNDVIGPTSAAAILVSDPDRSCPVPEDLLGDLYGLTPAEAHLATSLCGVERIEDVAAAKGVTIHTMRSHLQQIFAKVEVTRQSDLVRIILTGPGSLPLQCLRPPQANGSADPDKPASTVGAAAPWA